MESLFRKSASAIVICLMFACISHGQDIRNERLLNLYYLANQAKEAGDTDIAIRLYTEIQESYPSSPEPYMHLGDIYASMEADNSAIEKAAACYRRYMELNPDSEDRVNIEAKIRSLEKQLIPPEGIIQAADTVVLEYTRIPSAFKEKAPELIEIFNDTARSSDSSSVALNDLGCLYANGIGTSESHNIAAALFEESSRQGNILAKLNLAHHYRKGLGVRKSIKRAMELYHEAYDAGYSDAMVLCGDACLDSIPDIESGYKAAMEYYQKAIISRSPLAYLRMGQIHKDGLGIEKDRDIAWSYYQKAARSLFPEVLVEIGLLYKKGEIVLPDQAKAMKYFRQAASKGNPQAMLELSEMYLKGQGVEVDTGLAKEWFHLAKKTEDTDIKGYNSIKNKINAILVNYN